MPTTNNPIRKRPEAVRVMFSESEKNELQRAADVVGMALSVFIRVSALELARQREMKAA